MTQHYTSIQPEDEALAAQTFRGFVERTTPKGKKRTEAIFYCDKDSIPSVGAPYDLLRPIFRATGATVGGVEINNIAGYRVTISADKNVRHTIETILAKDPAATGKQQRSR